MAQLFSVHIYIYSVYFYFYKMCSSCIFFNSELEIQRYAHKYTVHNINTCAVMYL